MDNDQLALCLSLINAATAIVVADIESTAETTQSSVQAANLFLKKLFMERCSDDYWGKKDEGPDTTSGES